MDWILPLKQTSKQENKTTETIKKKEQINGMWLRMSKPSSHVARGNADLPLKITKKDG